MVASISPSRLVCPEPFMEEFELPPILMEDPMFAFRFRMEVSRPKRAETPASVDVDRLVSVVALFPAVEDSSMTMVTMSFTYRAFLSVKSMFLPLVPAQMDPGRGAGASGRLIREVGSSFTTLDGEAQADRSERARKARTRAARPEGHRLPQKRSDFISLLP